MARAADGSGRRIRRLVVAGVAASVVAAAATWAIGAREVQAAGWPELLGLAACQDGAEVQLTEDVSQTSEILAVGCDATIDLNGHRLQVLSVDVLADLTIDDTAGGGSLEVTTQNVAGLAGIHVPAGTSVTIRAGHVDARGGQSAAGIGAEMGEDAGSVTVLGGTVFAQGGNRAAAIGAYHGGAGGTVDIDGGTVHASAGANAPGIGSGCSGGDARLRVGQDATVTVETFDFSNICEAQALRLAGPPPVLEVHGMLRLRHATQWAIDVPAGSGPAVVVGATGTITGPENNPTVNARFAGDGRIDNHGVIALDQSLVNAVVTDHNYLLTFQPAAAPAQPIRVFAPDFASSYRVAPPLPPGSAWFVPAENRWWSEDEELTHDLTLVEATQPLQVTVTDPGPVVAGSPVDITAVVSDQAGPLDPQPPLEYASSNPTDSFAGNQLTATQAGTRTITVTEPDSGTTGTVEVTVIAGPVDDLTLVPSATTVDPGGSVTFTVTGTDAYGNPVDTTGVVLTSSVPTDEIDGLTVTFPTAGQRQITATLDGETASATIDVTAAQSLTIAVDDPGPVVAGDPVDITAVVSDQDGPLDPQPPLEYQSSNPADTFAGNQLTATTAGTRTITVTEPDSGATGTVEVTVIAGPVDDLVMAPPATSVEQGGSVTFTVIGTDTYGNPVDTSGVVLSSSVPTDEIDGLTVTFPTAGSRQITATVDGETASATIDVTAAPSLTIAVTDPGPVIAGVGVDVVAVVSDQNGPVDPQPPLEYQSSNPTDTFAGNTLTATEAGTRTITVTEPDSGATTTVEVTVVPGPVDDLVMAPPATTVDQGGSVTFTVTGTDAYGNPVDTTGVVLASSVPTDEIDGLTVTFPTAGQHEITATLDGETASATIDVTAAQSLTVTVDDPGTVVAGNPVDITAVVSDQDGPLDPQPPLEYQSSNPTDTFAGNTLTATQAGTRTITVTEPDSGATGTVEVTVIPGALDALTLVPSATTVDQGGSVTFTVTGTDAYGNPVDTTGVVLTSSVATDQIDGLTVTFPTASPHVITATLDDEFASVTIDVVPTATPPPPATPAPQGSPPAPPLTSGLPATGTDAARIALLGGLLVLLGALGVLATRRPRRHLR